MSCVEVYININIQETQHDHQIRVCKVQWLMLGFILLWNLSLKVDLFSRY